MLTRAISGLVFITIVIGSLFLGYYSSLILFGIIAFIGTLEYYKLAKKVSVPFKITGAFFSSSLVLGAGYLIIAPQSLFVYSIWMLFAITFVLQVLASKSNRAISDISVTITGAFYLAIPFISLLIIGIYPSFSPINFNWLMPLSIYLLTWTNDTGAYLSGRSFGKHKLFERISPNKTWEGSIGGGIFTIIMALVLQHYFGVYSIPVWIGIAILTSIFANIGDLLESTFKRNAEVKDSGKIMPGHGGILDRFDAILMTAPVVLAYLFLVSNL